MDARARARTEAPARPREPRRFLPAVAALALVALVACHSFRPVPVAQIGAWVRPGDTVRVYTHDGGSATFHVASVSSEELIGREGERFALDEISRLEAYRFDLTRTLLLPFAAVGVIVGGAVYLVVGNPGIVFYWE